MNRRWSTVLAVCFLCRRMSDKTATGSGGEGGSGGAEN